MHWNKTKMERKLHNHVMNLEFTKMDGTRRVMRATLREDLVPEFKGTSTRHPVRENPNHVRVYDLDKQDWRSFTLDQVNSDDAVVRFEVE